MSRLVFVLDDPVFERRHIARRYSENGSFARLLETYLIVGILPLLSDLSVPSLSAGTCFCKELVSPDRAPSLKDLGCNKDDGLGLV